MADGEDHPENKTQNGETEPDDNVGLTEGTVKPLQLDLGDEITHSVDANRLGNQASEAGNLMEPPKREDNPFSFKHFLRSDSNNCYQNKGARPKVYYEGRTGSVPSSSTDNDNPKQQGRVGAEYSSSALPDFVQDHLVVEQCYLGTTQSAYSFELPDFTQSSDSVKINRFNLDSSQNSIRRSDEDSDLSIPLDLPARPPQTGFPLDLPINTPSTSGRNCESNEAAVSKSLPDFLADGAARPQNSIDLNESPERENDRLRRELDVTRRQLVEQTRRTESLKRELDLVRNKEHNYTQNLVKALEQVEKNLERSNNSRISAENTILLLRQENKTLNTQVNRLKLENQSLKNEEGASNSHQFNISHRQSELHSQRLAQELKAAASSAEHSLRQLLTGVDNLRTMAATLENMHRIEEKCDNTFLNFDEDSGPAL